MGNRGNQDYFKLQGTRTEDRDLADTAHRHLSEQTADERRRRKHTPTGPQATPVHVHMPPKYKEPEPAAPTPSAKPPATKPPPEPTPLAMDIARTLAEGAWRVASWAASAGLDLSRRAIERRVDRLRDKARRIEQATIGRAFKREHGEGEKEA